MTVVCVDSASTVLDAVVIPSGLAAIAMALLLAKNVFCLPAVDLSVVLRIAFALFPEEFSMFIWPTSLMAVLDSRSAEGLFERDLVAQCLRTLRVGVGTLSGTGGVGVVKYFTGGFRSLGNVSKYSFPKLDFKPPPARIVSVTSLTIRLRRLFDVWLVACTNEGSCNNLSTAALPLHTVGS